LFKGIFSSVSCRRHSSVVSHLLAKNVGICLGKFPSAIAAVTKRMLSGLWELEGSQNWLQEFMQHIGFA